MKLKVWPTTLEEAVGVVLVILSDDEKRLIARMTESSFLGLHSGLGIWIGNNLGLRHGNHALIQAVAQQTTDNHPDEATRIILDGVWQRVRELAPKVH